jgi:glycosyltransferase involved in cell wall biosynthesis
MQRLKYEQYFDHWRENGYDITVSSFIDEATWPIAYRKGHTLQKVWGVIKGYVRRVGDLGRIGRFDLVYVLMWVTPFGTSLFERLVRRRAVRLVVDVEDNVLASQKLPAGVSPNPLARLLKGPRKARYLISEADHVITGSPFFRDECLALNRFGAATYVTATVEADRYRPSNRYDNSATVTVGWTGTFSSKPYLDLLRPAFSRLAKSRRFKLLVIGNFNYDLPGVDLEVVEWTKAREIEDLQRFDIGVYPLPADDWVSAKSGLKAIQYMAMAIPTVADRLGTAPLIVRDGVDGILVSAEDEWVVALERLIDDPDERRRMGENARHRFEEAYSTRALRTTYLGILDRTVGVARTAANPEAPETRRSANAPR